MTGLSVLYAREAANEREMAEVRDRERTGRLREIYWLRRVESKSGREPFINLRLHGWMERGTLGRRSDEPGDGFLYLVSMMPEPADSFEWFEVTEVFASVPARQIEGAMEAWHGIPGKRAVDFDEFLRTVPRGRPSRVEQRRAADAVIAQVERKLTKCSYRDLREKYGYGTLVVGMPLWFAVPPDEPYRVVNAVDDFMTRISMGLEEIRKGVLGKPHCPFRRVVVVWDTTPQALRSWQRRRSAAYEDAAHASLNNPQGASLVGTLSDALEQAVSKTKLAECDAPSMCLYLSATTSKTTSGTGPSPELVTALGKALRDGGGRAERPLQRLHWKAALTLWKLLCFVRIRGVEGLVHWLVRRFSVAHAMRARAVRREAARLYRESRRRGRVFRSRHRARRNRCTGNSTG